MPSDDSPDSSALSAALSMDGAVGDLCSPEGSALRRQVILFLRGECLANLPELQYYAHCFLFLPNCEVSIERAHSYVSQRIRIVHAPSPSYISVTLRKSEIISAHAEDSDGLVKCLEAVRDRRKVIYELGLVNHPEFDDFRSDDGKLDTNISQQCVNKVFCGLKSRELLHSGDRPTRDPIYRTW